MKRGGDLVEALRLAPTVAAACSVVVEHLLAAGMTLPSMYLERGGRLRCQAVRGYWQVFDGMPVEAGVIGSTFRRGQATEIRGVIDSQDYLAATLAVVDEVCVPIVADGHVVGALNVESTTGVTGAAAGAARSDHQRGPRPAGALGGRLRCSAGHDR